VTADPPLPPAFYERPVLEVATDLLGAVITHRSERGPVAVRLTEVEAYDGESDPGSHAFRGRTPRNAVMFGRAGHVYVYFSYGMHWCMNLVCGPVGAASAVLLRAGEVVEGADLAAVRRPTAKTPRELARGPARLTSALGVDGGCNGTDATDPGSPLTVTRAAGRPRDLAAEVLHGPRVGVAGDGAVHPWRFWLAGEPSVSAYRAAVSRRRPARG
jgi:DNA-3-methyladenine glycosylase